MAARLSIVDFLMSKYVEAIKIREKRDFDANNQTCTGKFRLATTTKTIPISEYNGIETVNFYAFCNGS